MNWVFYPTSAQCQRPSHNSSPCRTRMPPLSAPPMTIQVLTFSARYHRSWRWMNPQNLWNESIGQAENDPKLVGKSEYMMAETSNMRLRCHRHDKEWSPTKRTCRTWQDMHMIGLIHEAPEVTLTKATSSTAYEVPTKIVFRNTTAMPMQNSGAATTCYK